PMALGLGEGGEQNAPLGRAVIGGLLVATIFTLVIVPLIYSVLRRHAVVRAPEPYDPAAGDGDGVGARAGTPAPRPALQPAFASANGAGAA
ncbi:MAG TPA: efflux RND transporter permease subunit, partial [Gemmatirosa sp.]